MSEVIAIVSGKDGVGKTVIATNLGVVLARQGHSVLLMDMNIGSRNLDIRMGLEDRVVYDMADIFNGICRIKKAVIKDERFDNLYLISAPQNKRKACISKEQIMALCEDLKKVFDYIIIDAPPGTGSGFQLAAHPADRAIIVMVPEYAGVRDAELLNDSLKLAGVERRSLIINKIFPELHSTELIPAPEEISELLRLPIDGLIAYDRNIHVSANMGVPISALRGNYISVNLEKIAERIVSKN